MDPTQHAAIEKASGGTSLSELSATLLHSIDADANTQLAVEKFNVPAGPGEEPTHDEQLVQVEREQMAAALKPFHHPKLREAILAAKRSLEQVIDEQTPDRLLRAGFDAEALEKAKAMLTRFRQFIEDNKDEIEALQVLYSVPTWTTTSTLCWSIAGYATHGKLPSRHLNRTCRRWPRLSTATLSSAPI